MALTWHRAIIPAPLLAGLVLLGGCIAIPPGPITATETIAGEGNWRQVATDRDRLRMRGWNESWTAALADASTKGHAADVAAEGALLDPGAALPNAYLPASDYRCRTIKLGAPQPQGLGFTAYGWFQCRVAAEQGLYSIVKQTGSQRPVGLVFPDTLRRQIFLGTLVLGDETMPVDYGSDWMRDMAALVERIGPQRWRMVFPAPAYESLLDVIELVPAN